MPAKLDLIKTYRDYYTATKQPAIVEFGPLPYVTIEGQGEPGGMQFTCAVEALYPLAYGVKKLCKAAEQDFGVPKLEGLWWVTSGKPALQTDRSEWFWKLMIRMPEYVNADLVEQARAEVAKKKNLKLIDEIKLEIIDEQKCVQIMHVGPYSTEPETLQLVYDFMSQNGHTGNGLHHEIYLSDPNKTAPEKMKTILRQPVK